MKTIALFAVLCAAAAPAAAAVTVTAELSRNRLTIGSQLMLSVTVAGDQTSLPAPKLPALDAFNVAEAGSGNNFSFVNGHVSASVAYNYVLTPRAIGKFQIPAITADGASPSAPLSVEVFAAGALPAPAPATTTPAPSTAHDAPARPARARSGPAADIFVAASLDRPRAYVNQQVILSVRFFNAVPPMGDVVYEAPKMTGVLTEDLPPTREGMTQIDGRPYHYSEIKVALFPIAPGRLTIGPATVRCQVAGPSSAGEGQDFFDRFFAMAAPQQVTLNSDPLVLQVDALPAGKPEDFTGIVGRLAARASVDRAEVKVGDAVNLTLVVSGAGDLKSLPEPKKPDLPSLRFFQTESASAVDKANDRVGGSKTFRTVLVPRVSGTVVVPPFAFWYFDPERKAYARAETAAIPLKVLPGTAGTATTASAPAPASAVPGLTAIADDIRYLKDVPARAAGPSLLSAFAALGPWNALPFAFLLAAAFVAWRRRAAESDPRGRRRREALGRAETRLKTAAALPPAEAARAAALAGEALAAFVADKLDAPAAGLTLKSALEGLRSLPKPPSAATLARLASAWEEADLRRFAPGGAAGDAALFSNETSALLKALDQELRR